VRKQGAGQNIAGITNENPDVRRDKLADLRCNKPAPPKTKSPGSMKIEPGLPLSLNQF
jgi:hypothetical protein